MSYETKRFYRSGRGARRRFLLDKSGTRFRRSSSERCFRFCRPILCGGTLSCDGGCYSIGKIREVGIVVSIVYEFGAVSSWGRNGRVGAQKGLATSVCLSERLISYATREDRTSSIVYPHDFSSSATTANKRSTTFRFRCRFTVFETPRIIVHTAYEYVRGKRLCEVREQKSRTERVCTRRLYTKQLTILYSMYRRYTYHHTRPFRFLLLQEKKKTGSKSVQLNPQVVSLDGKLCATCCANGL